LISRIKRLEEAQHVTTTTTTTRNTTINVSGMWLLSFSPHGCHGLAELLRGIIVLPPNDTAWNLKAKVVAVVVVVEVVVVVDGYKDQ